MPALKLNLRLRIALTFAIFCMFVVGALGIALYMASEEMEEALIEQIIDEEMSYVLERYAQHAGFIPQAGASPPKRRNCRRTCADWVSAATKYSAAATRCTSPCAISAKPDFWLPTKSVCTSSASASSSC
jgi:hypothetical protein